MKCVLLIEKDGQQNAVRLSLDETNPVVVGRSWSSDVIVGDQYVDSEHLKISANDDHFIVEDLNSENGTKVRQKKIDQKSDYKLGEIIVVGETTLRLIDANTEVAPTIKFDRSVRFLKNIDNYWSVGAALVFATLAMLAQSLWATSDEFRLDQFATMTMAIFAFIFIWASIGGILGKLFRQKSAFIMSALVVCTAIILTAVLELAGNVIKFNLNSVDASRVIDQGVGLIVLSFAVYATLSLVTRFRRFGKTLLVGFACALSLVISLYLPTLTPEHERWSSGVTDAHEGQPTELFFGATGSLDTHLEKTDQLFEQFDEYQ